MWIREVIKYRVVKLFSHRARLSETIKMAELVGVVAGGAGLASLAIQLFETAQKLRHVYAAIRGKSRLRKAP